MLALQRSLERLERCSDIFSLTGICRQSFRLIRAPISSFIVVYCHFFVHLRPLRADSSLLRSALLRNEFVDMLWMVLLVMFDIAAYLGLLEIVFSKLLSRIARLLWCLFTISWMALSNFFFSYSVSIMRCLLCSCLWLTSFFSSTMRSISCFFTLFSIWTTTRFSLSALNLICSVSIRITSSPCKAWASEYFLSYISLGIWFRICSRRTEGFALVGSFVSIFSRSLCNSSV